METFRLAAKRLLLTYKTHVNKEGISEWLRLRGAGTVYVAWETGHEDTPYEHSHIFTEHGDRWQTRNARYFDWEGIHPHIEVIRSRVHHERILRYIAKEDTSLAFLKETLPKNCVERIWEKPTLQEALRGCENLRDVIPTIATYQHRPIEEPEMMDPTEWRPWQTDVLEILSHQPSDRKIFWITDLKGGSGKSYLSRWIRLRGHALIVDNFNRTTDFMEMALQSLESGGWDGRIVIADLPKSAETKNIYEPLECIKNGHIQTTKYRGTSRYIDIPHVVVFANFGPRRDGALSEDRIVEKRVETNSWTLS